MSSLQTHNSFCGPLMSSHADPLRFDKDDFCCWLDSHQDIYKEIQTLLYKMAILDKTETVDTIRGFLDKYGKELMLHGNIFMLLDYLTYYEGTWKMH